MYGGRRVPGRTKGEDIRNHLLKLTALAAVLAVPAVALGAATIYEGRGSSDPAAKISLKVAKKDGKRTIRRVAARKLAYTAGVRFCGTSGRTPEAVAKGSFRVKSDGSFRVVSQATTADPSKSGELKVTGTVTKRKITGKMGFTFGKDGCRTGPTEFVARP